MRLSSLNPRWVSLANWADHSRPFYNGVSLDCPCPRCAKPACPHCGHAPSPQRLSISFWPPIDNTNAASGFLVPIQRAPTAFNRLKGESFEDLTLDPSISIEGHDWLQITNGEVIVPQHERIEDITMTQVFKQRNDYDCFLCCLAMAVQKAPASLFSQEIFDQIEKDKGSARHATTEHAVLFERCGLVEDKDYYAIYLGGASPKGNILDLLHGRRAMLQVMSLNNEPPAQHYVYWDGHTLHDPSNKQQYRWLKQCLSAGYVYIFNEVTS